MGGREEGREEGRETLLILGIHMHSGPHAKSMYIFQYTVCACGMRICVCTIYASPGQSAHVINDIPDRDGHIRTYVRTS